MQMKAKQKMELMLKKYKTYISNLRWHIDTNKPDKREEQECLGKINCYSEVVKDLESIVTSKTPQP